MSEIKFKALHQDFKLPKQAHKGDAGFDLVYYGDKEIKLKLGEIVMIDLGFAMEMPYGYEAQIRPRSGLASKYGISVVNTPGTVDCSYRGPVKVGLVKVANSKVDGDSWEYLEPYVIKPGERVCQMVIQKLPEVNLSLADELSETVRGEGGFGSTGT